jgi:hypothetical protein
LLVTGSAAGQRARFDVNPVTLAVLATGTRGSTVVARGATGRIDIGKAVEKGPSWWKPHADR